MNVELQFVMHNQALFSAVTRRCPLLFTVNCPDEVREAHAEPEKKEKPEVLLIMLQTQHKCGNKMTLNQPTAW